MYAVIVGCSEVGSPVATALWAAGHEITVIEKRHSRCQLVWDALGTVTVQGDGTDEATLQSAGLARADLLVAVTGRDEVNLVACQVAKLRFDVPQTMAVIKDTKNEPLFHLLGVDLVVNSTHQVVTSLEEGVLGRPLVHLKNFRLPNLELVSITVPEDAGVVGKHWTEFDMPDSSQITLIVRADRPYLPSQVSALEAGDEIVAVTLTGEEQTLYDTLTGV